MGAGLADFEISNILQFIRVFELDQLDLDRTPSLCGRTTKRARSLARSIARSLEQHPRKNTLNFPKTKSENVKKISK